MLGPKIMTMELPHGRDWLWFPEWNILALAPHLGSGGRDRAVDEFHAEWRQSLKIPAPAQRHSPRRMSGLTIR